MKELMLDLATFEEGCPPSIYMEAPEVLILVGAAIFSWESPEFCVLQERKSLVLEPVVLMIAVAGLCAFLNEL